jgi:hypothetical protein
METPVNTETQTEPDLDQIMDELDKIGRQLPVAAIRAAQQHGEAIIPRLIEAIRRAISEAQKGAPPEGNAHFFALYLLTEFQAKEAWPVIREAISLPGTLPDDLFGDAITETLPRVFVVMIGDRPDVIDELVRNRDLNEFVRWSGARAYVYLVAAARLTKDEAVHRLQRLLSEAIEAKDLDITAPLISVLTDLRARQAREEIEKAFQLELVDESVIDLVDVENELGGDESNLAERFLRRPEGPILDTVAELDKWGAFKETQSDDLEDEFDEFADDDQDDQFDDEVFDNYGTVRHAGPRIGRNDPCPCGSGKKYKKCCGGRK